MVLSKHLAGDAKTSSGDTTCGAARRLGRVSFLPRGERRFDLLDQRTR
jgi:hypothetical protein